MMTTMTTSTSPRSATYTKAQCKTEIHILDQLIRESWLNPYLTAPLIEMRIIWIERLGDLVAKDGGVFPGRKFHP
jgi:hypothetical protein